MSTTPMTDKEAQEFIAKGGEFGELVSKLTQRVVDAETKCSTQEVTIGLQEREIENLQKRLSNSEEGRETALRNLGLVDDAQNKITAILRETRGQRESKIIDNVDVTPLSGKPTRSADPKLRAVDLSAFESTILREQVG